MSHDRNLASGMVVYIYIIINFYVCWHLCIHVYEVRVFGGVVTSFGGVAAVYVYFLNV